MESFLILTTANYVVGDWVLIRVELGCNKNEKDHFVDNKHFGVAKPEGAYKVCAACFCGIGVKIGKVSNFYPTEKF